MNSFKEIDTSYIISLREGDRAAFTVIFHFYNNRLFSFVYRFLKDREQTEEIIQETFLSLWMNREKIDTQYNMGSYLYTIARRLTLNQIRNTANSDRLKERLWHIIETAQNPTEESVFLADLNRQLEHTISHLPRQQQLIFRLSRQEGLTHEEIARRFSISSNTVKNHLVQALKKMRLKFGQMEYFIFLAACFFYK